ncbi:MAG: nickel/cobalt transporter [Rhizobiales bacterium]|nr:nickel/cobalt transporter [Hyphomicrobiales bacterium]OJU36777.1 MAG: delayed-early response protein/equilibrative nucleoside transporter [Rhizobiales bacterium 68-8]
MRVREAAAAVALAALAMAGLVAAAHAQSSLGIGTNEATLPSTGLFAHVLNWVNVEQQRFYRALAGALKSMRDGGGGLWLLIGLSFAYGVFHAAGPGHGKAVISSYMIANEVALRRGIVLSFVSALLQGVSAIVLMGLVYVVLAGTSLTMTDASRFLEIGSYALVTGFGAWLLWRKAGRRLVALMRPAPMLAPAGMPGVTAALFEAHGGDARTDAGDAKASAPRRVLNVQCTHPDIGPGEICAECGHSHAPDPSMLSGRDFDWRTAWTAIVAVGIRPCTGALIVLSFALLNGLIFGGVVSVLAMSIGTAITVSVLATLAVTAKNWALALTGSGSGGALHAAIEIAGAALVFLLGALMLAASLSA